jgi:vancomycin permeability regulator SanA
MKTRTISTRSIWQRAIRKFWLIPDNPPTQPGCFVIPSYALKNRTLPTRPTRAQIELAVEWWNQFPHAKLIMSTGDNQFLEIPNSTVMAEYAMRLGVPRENIIEEDRSRNTYQNLAYSMEIIQAQGLAQPTLVTIDLYTRRAVATANRLDWRDFYWLSVYSAGEPAYGYKWLQTHSRPTIFIYEVGATVWSKLIGWV